ACKRLKRGSTLGWDGLGRGGRGRSRRGRSGRRGDRRRRGDRGLALGAADAADDRGVAGLALEDADRDRGQDEDDERGHGELVQERRRAAGPKGGLGAAAPEDREVRALALLQEDDEDEEDADQDMYGVQQIDHGIRTSESGLWPSGANGDDTQKTLRVKTGPSDEEAVDVRLADQTGRIV